jgi:hypothetical protein
VLHAAVIFLLALGPVLLATWAFAATVVVLLRMAF